MKKYPSEKNLALQIKFLLTATAVTEATSLVYMTFRKSTYWKKSTENHANVNILIGTRTTIKNVYSIVSA